MTMSNQQDLELLAEARRYYGDAVHYDDGVFSVQTGKARRLPATRQCCARCRSTSQPPILPSSIIVRIR